MKAGESFDGMFELIDVTREELEELVYALRNGFNGYKPFSQKVHKRLLGEIEPLLLRTA